MVAIDAEFDRLKAAQKSGWAGIPDQPDVTPSHTATILWEHFRELLRSEDTASRSTDYRTKLSASEQAAGQLRNLLRGPKAEVTARDAAFQSLGKSCATCHKQYRN